jgi:hypothetical protein
MFLDNKFIQLFVKLLNFAIYLIVIIKLSTRFKIFSFIRYSIEVLILHY